MIVVGVSDAQRIHVLYRGHVSFDHGGVRLEPPQADIQLDLFRGQEEVVVDALRKLDLDTLTPLAALNVLASLRARLEGME